MNAQKKQSISPSTLFYSYADEDEELRKELEKHLSLLQQQGMIAGWHHHKIMPGTNRNEVTDERFSSAQIILLLISPDFLASDASQTQMQRALQRHTTGLAHVIPLLLRPVDWEQASFGHLQALPRNGKPVTAWRNRDQAFANIAKDIRSAIEQWNASHNHSPQSPISVPLYPFLFLSSARKDLSLVNRLKDDLQAYGIVGWVDHKTVLDAEDIRKAIRNASAVILVASAHTRRSRSVKHELQIAEVYQRAIYLFWMQGNDLIEVMPTGWSHLLSFDARAERYLQAFQDLLQAFGKQTSTSSSSSVQKEYDTNASHYPGKYTIKSEGPQGQVIGEHVYVTMNFGNGQEEDEPPPQNSSNKSDHAQVSPYPSSQDHLLEQLASSLEAPRNPYKGLQAFRAEEAQDFFGRDRLIEELLEKVRQLLTMNQQDKAASRLLTVLGASGSGKSSVVMAGLLPKLKQGTLAGSEHWIYLNPIVPGPHPLEALALALAPLFRERGPMGILEDLKDDSARGLHLLLMTCVKQSDMSILLVIDQFEELFTQTTTEDERQQFLDLLLAATSELHGPLLVVLTLRADFYDRPLQYPDLGRLIKSHQVIVFPMEMPDLRKVIEQPAQLPDVQLTFQEDLVGDLLFDVQGQAGVLPLLQFTLDQLFQDRQGRLLTRQTYQKIGGVKGALAQHAESTYQSLPSEAHQRLARALFLRLINLGTVQEDATKRRVPLSELMVIDSEETARLAEVTNAFTKARLLTANTVGEIPTVEVSHEALIRAWTRLREWVSSARDDIHLLQTISEDVVSWEQHNKSRDRLYRGSQLKEAKAWAARNILSSRENSFLQASGVYQTKSRTMMAVLILFFSLAPGFLLWSFFQPTVTSLADSGPGSLRAAIAKASNGSTITFDSSLRGKIILKQDDLNIARNVTILGPGATQLIISAGNSTPRIRIFPQVTVTISNLSFQDNASVYMVTNDGTLFLKNCSVMNNGAISKAGGGISNYEGTMVVVNSIISGNTTLQGAVSNVRGTLTFQHSTISYNTTTEGGYAGGIFNDTGALVLKESTVAYNMAANGSGGGISNTGTLTLENSLVEHNTAMSGGGVFNTALRENGVLTLGIANITNSSILQNTAEEGNGGGIANNGGTITLVDSGIAGNAALVGNGGGISNLNLKDLRSHLTLVNSTVSGNQAAHVDSFGGYGGGIFNQDGRVDITFCTIYGNKATIGGGGVEAFQTTTDSPPQVVLQASIIARNSASTGSDILGSVKSLGYNLLTKRTGTSISGESGSTDIIDDAFLLPALQQNGGSTLIHALPSNSPARNRIPHDACLHLHISTDQRGVKRTQEAKCDIGAYQYAPTAVVR